LHAHTVTQRVTVEINQTTKDATKKQSQLVKTRDITLKSAE